MINYVIFDMDGTLLDTEPIFEKAWNEIGEKWGLRDIDKLYCKIVGRSRDTIIKLLEDTYGKDVDCKGYYAERMERAGELFDGYIPLKKGTLEILKFLREENIAIAVATSTVMQIAEKNLRKTGLWDYIDMVVTSEMVENGKPAPDIFLEAASRIGAKKEECIVCEDSYNGIKAAHASGMRPIMIPDMLPPTDETDRLVYKTCTDMFEVMELIKKENKIN